MKCYLKKITNYKLRVPFSDQRSHICFLHPCHKKSNQHATLYPLFFLLIYSFCDRFSHCFQFNLHLGLNLSGH